MCKIDKLKKILSILDIIPIAQQQNWIHTEYHSELGKPMTAQ